MLLTLARGTSSSAQPVSSLYVSDTWSQKALTPKHHRDSKRPLSQISSFYSRRLAGERAKSAYAFHGPGTLPSRAIPQFSLPSVHGQSFSNRWASDTKTKFFVGQRLLSCIGAAAVKITAVNHNSLAVKSSLLLVLQLKVSSTSCCGTGAQTRSHQQNMKPSTCAVG
jgi:hypothetical protein